MLVAVDIGNTNISFGVFKGKKLIKRFAILTKGYRIEGLRKSLRKFNIDDSIICSVVPKVTSLLKDDLKKLLHKRPYCLSENIRVPLENL